MSKWNLIINVGRCENCNNCVIAERDEHTGNDFPGYAAPAAAVGDSPIRIQRRVQGEAPMVETTYLPVMCNHCDDAPCMRYAPDAIRKRDDGIVIIDPEKARGRKDIVGSCPYRAIVWNEEQQVPQTWIFDAHLLDQGWSRPRCQQSCPTDVFEAVKLDDAAMAEKAEKEGLRVLKPRSRDQAPRLVPGAGPLGDLLRRRQRQRRDRRRRWSAWKGRTVTLSQAGKLLATTVTDGFGDFRFDDLPKNGGAYRVEVSHSHGSAMARLHAAGKRLSGGIEVEWRRNRFEPQYLGR